jgi:hypothetical protein
MISDVSKYIWLDVATKNAYSKSNMYLLKGLKKEIAIEYITAKKRRKW